MIARFFRLLATLLASGLSISPLHAIDARRPDPFELRDEARELTAEKRYAEALRLWLEAALLMAAADQPAEAYWAYWQAALCERQLGDFGRSSEHFALADALLQRAKTRDPITGRQYHALMEINLRNGWGSTCYSDGRIGQGFTIHQRARASLSAYLQEYHGGTSKGLEELTGNEAAQRLDVQLNDARYLEARGDLTGAMAVVRDALRQTAARSSDPMLGGGVSRARNNFANVLNDLGDDAGAEQIYIEGLASAPEGSHRDLLKLNLARLRSQAEGPTTERIAEVRALSEKAARDGDYLRSLNTRRRLAVMLSTAGKEAESATLFEELLQEARAHHDVPSEMDILLWRAKRRTASGQLDGLEADLLHVLAHVRSRGLMLDVFDVERSYGRLLRKQSRSNDALLIFHQALAHARGMGATALVPELLVEIATLYEELGDHAQAIRLWSEFDAILATHSELKGWRRFLLMMDKLRYLARTGAKDAARSYAMEVASFITSSHISEYRSKDFAQFNLEAELVAAAPVVQTTTEKIPAVDLQPVLARTEVPPDEPGRVRFTLSNPTAAAQSGTLEITGLKVTRVTRDNDKGTIALAGSFAPAGSPWSAVLEIGRDDQWLISLETEPTATGQAQLTWKSAPQQVATWTLGTREGGSVYVINASETVLNPFYAVPVYHELYFDGVTHQPAAVRVVASRSCRVELSGTDGDLLAVDADGNGSYLDRGDALYSAREGFPEIAPQGGANVAAFELQVFLLDDDPGDLELTIQTRSGTEWKTQATDRIHPPRRK